MGINADKLSSGIVEGTLVEGGEKLAADTDDLLINIHHGDLLDRIVNQHLPQGSSFPTPSDENPLRIGMGYHRWMYQRFVIDELIFLAGLNLAIQRQHLAKGEGLEDLDGLKS